MKNYSHPDMIHIHTQNQNETFETLIEWRKLVEKIALETSSEK